MTLLIQGYWKKWFLNPSWRLAVCQRTVCWRFIYDMGNLAAAPGPPWFLRLTPSNGKNHSSSAWQGQGAPELGLYSSVAELPKCSKGRGNSSASVQIDRTRSRRRDSAIRAGEGSLSVEMTHKVFFYIYIAVYMSLTAWEMNTNLMSDSIDSFSSCRKWSITL